jgi:hypothetical protein
MFIGVLAISPVISRNMNIIVTEDKHDSNSDKDYRIVIKVGQRIEYIERAVAHGNHKYLTESQIEVDG